MLSADEDVTDEDDDFPAPAAIMSYILKSFSRRPGDVILFVPVDGDGDFSPLLLPKKNLPRRRGVR